MNMIWLILAISAVPGIITAIKIPKRQVFDFDRGIKDKISELTGAYEESVKNIDMITDLDQEFFNDSRVIGALKSAADKGVKVRIIYDEEAELPSWIRKNKKIETRARKGEAIKRLTLVTSEAKLHQHLMVIDNRLVRLEIPHIPRNFGKIRRMFHFKDRAMIIRNDPILGRKCDEFFEKMWRECR